MQACDVAIVGGGPAGAACAWSLRRAGVDVVVVDKAVFPRDKVCAGWITPPVLAALSIDPDEYRDGRTFQPITGFRVGVVGRADAVDAPYGRPVSFGIRRCEFDDYLLRRSGARLMLGAPAAAIRRAGSRWVVNDAVAAPILVGAGGHFCPVARMLNGATDRAPLVAAQEVELPLDRFGRAGRAVDGERPELYFCPDLSGYGWCFRKGGYLNVGFGRLHARAMPAAVAGFVEFLRARGRISGDASAWRWRGHAYLVSASCRRRAVADGVMLVGDAAGLAYPQSGEGIRPAIESGLMAASAILHAAGRYGRDDLESYEHGLAQRFGSSSIVEVFSRAIPPGITAAVARTLLDRPWFVRRVVLDRWFLHAGAAPRASRTPCPH